MRAAIQEARDEMEIADILKPDCLDCDVVAGSKKKALEHVSKLISEKIPALSQSEIFESLIARERLGSTGLGHGVAIPHGRVGHIHETRAAFIRTKDAIDFDAIDGEPVDLIFALLVPENSTDEHLKTLARIAELFSDDGFVGQLRNEQTCDGAYALLTQTGKG